MRTDDPFAIALRNNTEANVIARVGDQSFVLNAWMLRKDGGTPVDYVMETEWRDLELEEKAWRIPWRKRFRIVLDRIWWRATGWI